MPIITIIVIGCGRWQGQGTPTCTHMTWPADMITCLMLTDVIYVIVMTIIPPVSHPSKNKLVQNIAISAAQEHSRDAYVINQKCHRSSSEMCLLAFDILRLNPIL